MIGYLAVNDFTGELSSSALLGELEKCSSNSNSYNISATLLNPLKKVTGTLSIDDKVANVNLPDIGFAESLALTKSIKKDGYNGFARFAQISFYLPRNV